VCIVEYTSDNLLNFSTPFLSRGLESLVGSGACALAPYVFGLGEYGHVCILLGHTCPYLWSFFLIYPGMDVSMR